MLFFLSKNKYYEINDFECILRVGVAVMDGEVEPLVVAQGVGIVLYEQHVFLIFLVLVRAVQVAAFEAGVQMQDIRPHVFFPLLKIFDLLELDWLATANVLKLYFIFLLDA